MNEWGWVGVGRVGVEIIWIKAVLRSAGLA